MTQAPALYNLRLLAPNKFAMAKFDSDFNVAAIYNLEPRGGDYTCDCPANARTVVLHRCKHRRMIRFMLGAVNTNRFYEPQSGTWHEPLAPDLAALLASEASSAQQEPTADLSAKDITVAPVEAQPAPAPAPKPTVRRR